MKLTQEQTAKAVRELLNAAQNSENEEQFKIKAEGILEYLCKSDGVFWNSYTYEHSLLSGKKRIDAVHGSTIIEYEPPCSFNTSENARLRHACKQAEEYAVLLSEEEGRDIGKYSLVAWDGVTITFGWASGGQFTWESARPFDENCLNRLLTQIRNGGRPLVSPMLLKQFIGPDTEVGRRLLPVLFQAICKAQSSYSTTRTKLIYKEWARLFGQVDGTETERLAHYLETESRSHGIDYNTDPQAYVFALSTYIALVAKICAVYALNPPSTIENAQVPDPKAFLKNVESGDCFRMSGIENMLGTDFFSWYLGDDVTEELEKPLGLLIECLRTIDFDVTKKSPESVRDLFKGLYMSFTPAPMRHALGEYYTPDQLASHVIDTAGWDVRRSLLDPTCGSGTFILEGLRRRLATFSPTCSARELLDGLYGFDLNPLAVLTARASIVVFLAERFDPSDPVLLPVFLADAINTADPINGVFKHTILTEKGEREFSIPVTLAEAPDFFSAMDYLRECIDDGLDCEDTLNSLRAMSPTVNGLDEFDLGVLMQTIDSLVTLHNDQWNGIWCLILFDRIEAGCVRDVDLVVGNPPWVKWSNLPRSYAEFIKPICVQMDIFSEDVWVGGIQSDISTVVTYHSLERFVKKGGSLAFLITGTVFKNESSQGFRHWKLHTADMYEPLMVETVEDYAALRPFEGVANWPTLLLIRRNGQTTNYPVKYRRFSGTKRNTVLDFSSFEDLKAMPVPGSDAGPWLVGTEQEVLVWPKLFDAAGTSVYRARKGVTTDANGIFFVNAEPDANPKLVRITNDPSEGRNRNVMKITAIVEKDDIFPLLRGRDVQRFKTTPRQKQYIIVPQRGMFGDETLPKTRPRTYRFFRKFRTILEQRSSYRRFQQGKCYWSIWSTGDYTFAPYKVVWKEMSGSGFVAAYVGSNDFLGTAKIVIPDHKVYFVPLQSEEEAAYLTAFLNSRMVTSAINAYSSALSLGTSVTDYLNIPQFDNKNKIMVEMSQMAKRFKCGGIPSLEDEDKLDSWVSLLIGIN